MYDYLKGTLTDVSPTAVTVDVKGVGYRLQIPVSALSTLPQAGQNATLYCSFVVRENSQTLYGFPSSQERDFFEELIQITGVGPKLGLSLIGHLSYQELYAIVMDNNPKAICHVPGVGKKTAERLLIEMRSRVEKFSIPIPAAQPQSQTVHDAMNALVKLGYPQHAVRKVIEKLVDKKNAPQLEVLITQALREL